MNRYPENLEDWNLEFIKELVDEEHEENAYLEYKSKLKIDKDKLEKEFTAFANGNGGYIIFGIKDNHKITGIENPEDEELTQYIKEVLTNTDPLVKFQVSDPISLGEKTNKVLLVAKVEESNKKPVSTKNSSYYIRIGESAQPISRDQLMTMFVHRERKQENMRILEMEINRFLRVYEEDIEDTYLKGKPEYYKIDKEAIKDAVRKNNHLYTDEGIQKTVDQIFEAITKLQERERIYQSTIRKKPHNRTEEQINTHFNRELERKAEKLKVHLEKLKEEIRR